MRCPYCSDETNKVIDTRLARDGAEIRRRRECLECSQRFTTRERIEEMMPRVMKRDSRREEYSREKLMASIERACVKRPVSAEALLRVVERVERRMQESGAQEMPSAELGKRVLEELNVLDPIAAVRFASVFLDFESEDDYAAFFRALPPPSPTPESSGSGES